MLRKLLRVLGIVLAAAIVIGAALLLYLEPYVTYDRDGADRIADLGGVYVTTQMLRDPKAVRAALEQQGACAVLLQLKSTFGNFYYSSSIDGAELADVDTAAVDSLIDWLSQHGYTSLRRSRPSATRRLRWPIPLRPSRFRAAHCGWTPTAATGLIQRARP